MATPFATAAESCPVIVRAENFLQIDKVQHIRANRFKGNNNTQGWEISASRQNNLLWVEKVTLVDSRSLPTLPTVASYVLYVCYLALYLDAKRTCYALYIYSLRGQRTSGLMNNTNIYFTTIIPQKEYRNAFK